MNPEIKDVITLLNRMKGKPHAFHWENWMSFFIQTILGEDKFIDLVDIIATRLQRELSQVSRTFDFYVFLFFL